MLCINHHLSFSLSIFFVHTLYTEYYSLLFYAEIHGYNVLCSITKTLFCVVNRAVKTLGMYMEAVSVVSHLKDPSHTMRYNGHMVLVPFF